MRLVDNLRKAEKKGAMTIRRGVERAREEWADVERRIRQRMRIYPQKRGVAALLQSQPESLDTDLPAEPVARSAPIISVHGQDVEVKD